MRIVFFVLLTIVAFNQSIADIIELGVKIRDFSDTHPDFEQGILASETGIVENILGLDNLPVYDGAGMVTTNGQANFDQWYRDTPGINLSKQINIQLDNTITPNPLVYTFVSPPAGFFPIDNELFGNEGRMHNYHFTSEIHTNFQYNGGEIFTFTGDDDVWVFINGELVIDLGGVHAVLSASVSLDTLGLTPGNIYPLDFFHAERQTVQSNFRIDTTIGQLFNPGGVYVDVTPGEDSSCFQVDGLGFFRAAILGTYNVDVNQIDASTITLNGIPASSCFITNAGNPPFQTIDLADLLCLFPDTNDPTIFSAKQANIEGNFLNGAVFSGSTGVCLYP